MRGFLRFAIHCFSACILFCLLGIFLFPFLFLAPFCLFAIPFYPLFKLLLPEYMKRRGY